MCVYLHIYLKIHIYIYIINMQLAGWSAICSGYVGVPGRAYWGMMGSCRALLPIVGGWEQAPSSRRLFCTLFFAWRPCIDSVATFGMDDWDGRGSWNNWDAQMIGVVEVCWDGLDSCDAWEWWDSWMVGICRLLLPPRHTQHSHTQLSLSHTTLSCKTLSHTTLSHKLCHIQLCHTQHCRTQSIHKEHCHIRLLHTRTQHCRTQHCHTQHSSISWPSNSFCVAGLALTGAGWLGWITLVRMVGGTLCGRHDWFALAWKCCAWVESLSGRSTAVFCVVLATLPSVQWRSRFKYLFLRQAWRFLSSRQRQCARCDRELFHTALNLSRTKSICTFRRQSFIDWCGDFTKPLV